MTTSNELIDRARQWRGVPWLHQGRSKSGVDCVGLVECVLASLNVLPATYSPLRNYSRIGNNSLLPIIAAHCDQIHYAIPGALVLFQFPGTSGPSHVGIITHGGLLHATERSRRVVEHGYRGAWVTYTHSLYKFPGVIYG